MIKNEKLVNFRAKLAGKKLNFQNHQLPVGTLVIFVLIFAAIGSYIISNSFAATTLVYTSNNLDTAKSSGATKVTETGSQSKRNSQVVQVSNPPGTASSYAVFANSQQQLDAGQYKACLSAFAPNGTINGSILASIVTPNGQGASLGEGSFSLNQNADYAQAGCLSFAINASNTVIAVTIANQSVNVLRVGHVDVIRTGTQPPVVVNPPKPKLVAPLVNQIITETYQVAAAVPNWVVGQKVEVWMNDQIKLGEMQPTALGFLYNFDTTKYGNGNVHLNVITYDGNGKSYKSPNLEIIILNNAKPPTAHLGMPARIPSDCSRDVTADIAGYISYFGNNFTYEFPTNGCYIVNGKLDFTNLSNVTIAGNNTTMKVTTDGFDQCPAPPDINAGCSKTIDPVRGRHLWSFIGGSNITLRDLNVIGSNTVPGTDPSAYNPTFEAQHLFIVGQVDGFTIDHVNGSRSRGDFVFIGPHTPNVLVKNSTFTDDGRMGITINGSNVLVTHNKISNTRRSTIDFEPYFSEDTDIRNVEIIDNQFNDGYGWPFWISIQGGANILYDNLLVMGNRIHNKNMAINEQSPYNPSRGVTSVRPRTNFRIINNSTDGGADFGGGGLIYLQKVDGIEVRGNTGIITQGRNNSGLQIDSSNNVRVTDNNFVGAERSLWVTDSSGPSTGLCYSGNTILQYVVETSTAPCN